MRVTDANRIVWRDSLPLAIAMLNGQGGCLPHVEGDGYRWLEWLCQQILPEPVGFLEWNEKSGQMEIRPGKEKPYFDRLYGLKKGCWVLDGFTARPAPEEWIHAAIQETDGEDYELQRSVHQGLTLHDLAHRFREQGLSPGGSAGYQSFLDALRPAALPGRAALASQPSPGGKTSIPRLVGKQPA